MTTVTLLTTQLDHESPVTDVVMQALYNNPLAIASGTPGSPRVQVGALPRLVVGDDIRIRQDNTTTTTGSTWVTVFEIGFAQAGEVRITADHRAGTSAASDAEMKFRKVSASVTTEFGDWDTTSTSWQSRSADTTVIPGDLIYIEHHHETGSADSQVRYRRMSVDAASDYVPVSNFGYIEGNATTT